MQFKVCSFFNKSNSTQQTQLSHNLNHLFVDSGIGAAYACVNNGTATLFDLDTILELFLFCLHRSRPLRSVNNHFFSRPRFINLYFSINKGLLLKVDMDI